MTYLLKLTELMLSRVQLFHYVYCEVKKMLCASFITSLIITRLSCWSEIETHEIIFLDNL